jgi:eukaryotic-like serine/threonine-protein kinase
MSEQTTSDDPRRQRLEEVIGAFLVAVDAGQKPDPNEWLASHRDLCPELAEFFADLGRMDNLVEPVKPAPSQPLAEPTMSVDSTEERTPRAAAEPGLAATQADVGSADAGNGVGRSAALVRGTRVRYFGDYELEKVLGEGGMGIVYKARQRSLNRSVALKMIKATRFPSSDEVRRFQNEAEAVARLDHPNIVPIYEVNQFEDQHYFAMKLIAGESLDKRLNDYTADPKRAAKLVATAASAILHAHQRGILHRDLKPANILVDPDGQPHITDFGLAKRVEGDSELTRSGAILGTPAYMAPEQASGKRGSVTTSTDIYGLGAILYALLTGKAPFGGATVMDTLEQVRERSPEPPRRLNSRVPRDLEVICLQCLEKDSRRRYTNADALAEDLKRWLAGMPIAARPVGKAARFGMWCRRNPILAGAAGLVASVLVCASVISLLYAQQQTRLAGALRLYGDEQKQRATEQATATRRISAQASELGKQGQNLRTSLADTNRRLAMLNFERSQRAFDGGQVSHGLLYLVECWRFADKANDAAWQHLARANLSYWRYHCMEVKGKFSQRFASKDSFSPDGKTLVIQEGPKTARLWNIADERPIGNPMVPPDFLGSMILSPDGRTVLTVTDDHTVRLWDAANGTPIGQPMLHHDYPSDWIFSADCKTLVTKSVNAMPRVWDATTGQQVRHPMVDGSHTQFALSPDGKTVVTWGGNTNHARLWDATSGRPICSPLLHKGPVYSAAFGSDGKLFVTTSYQAARLWDASTGAPVGPIMAHRGSVTSAIFSPDCTKVLTVTNDGASVRLWSTGTALPLSPNVRYLSPGESSAFDHVLFSPDGRSFVIWFRTFNKAYLGDAASGLPIGKPLEHEGHVHTAVYSPDGKTVLTGSADRTARAWDAATGEPIGAPMAHPSEVGSVAFSADGTSALTASYFGGAWLWDIRRGLPLGQPLDVANEPWSVAFSPDGTKVLTRIGRDKCRLWDARSNAPQGQIISESDGIFAESFSPDCRTILTGSRRNSVRLWDAATCQPIGQPIPLSDALLRDTADAQGGMVSTVQYNKSGAMFVAINQAGLLVLGNPNLPRPVAHHLNVNCAAFSPDGRYVAIGSRARPPVSGTPLWARGTARQ